MPVISRLASIILRIAEIAFAAVNNPDLYTDL
jgi:hypothetical protein